MKSFDAIKSELASGASTCESLTREYLEAIDRAKHLNAFLSVFAEEAHGQARAVDRKIREGTAGPLAGMVVSIKDVMCVKGHRVTCGSKILEEFVAPYDATAVARLRKADAVIIGKTNMDEFAMGSSTENSAFGRVKLPGDESRVPGGSSGGSAVAVKAGMSTVSLGTDTGGSVRQPASFTGVVGLKPTYGRVSRYGLVAFASSFDQIGPLSLTARDSAAVLNVIAGHDDRDSTSATVPVPDFTAGLNKDVKGLRIGVPKEYFDDALQEEIRGAVQKKIDLLRNHGAVISEVTLPHTAYTIATYYILATAEASSNLARYDGARYGYRVKGAKSLTEMYTRSRSEGFGGEVKRRIMLGTYVLSAGYYDAYYRKGQKVRRLIKEDFDNAFLRVDCLITPTSPSTAFKAGEKMDDPLQMYLSDVYTTSANLAGIPGISIPCGTDRQGLPIGLQILGKQFDEETILRAADFLETSG
ncbi:MAG: Asp-tRNA(Asn)/Glu-tRNA(Gln) amidotransferase subunit GatA [Ignavibacteriales bacterium]|nr:Asp-tRNA(Asn)/Glu-tRNA(Gln) amidotransferase subunit GatA [Ignavibacteriales bacterium]